MMIKFREGGHPVFRAMSPLSQRTLKSKGGGKLSNTLLYRWGYGWKLFFAQLFLLIRSVSTEQFQICVKNTNPAMLEQGDLCFCRTIWPIVCAHKCDEDTYTFDWSPCTRRFFAKVQERVDRLSQQDLTIVKVASVATCLNNRQQCLKDSCLMSLYQSLHRGLQESWLTKNANHGRTLRTWENVQK